MNPVRFCTFCGGELTSDRSACSRCGQPLASMAAAATVPMPQVDAPYPAAPPVSQQAPSDKAAAMTMKAGAALKVSETYNAAFGAPFSGWRADLAEPVGPSTAGGKQALQPITLISSRGDRLTIGRLDTVHRQVTMRGHGVICRMYSERFGQPFTVSAGDYQQYLDKVGTFFSASGYAVSSEAPNASVSRAPSSGGQGLLWVVIAALVTAVILLSLLFLLR